MDSMSGIQEQTGMGIVKTGILKQLREKTCLIFMVEIL